MRPLKWHLTVTYSKLVFLNLLMKRHILLLCCFLGAPFAMLFIVLSNLLALGSLGVGGCWSGVFYFFPMMTLCPLGASLFFLCHLIGCTDPWTWRFIWCMMSSCSCSNRQPVTRSQPLTGEPGRRASVLQALGDTAVGISGAVDPPSCLPAPSPLEI